MPTTCFESSRKVRPLDGDQDAVQEIFHIAKGNGESKYHVRWRDPIVLRKQLAISERMDTKQRVTDHFEVVTTLASQTEDTG